jgi:putative hemolysin
MRSLVGLVALSDLAAHEDARQTGEAVAGISTGGRAAFAAPLTVTRPSSPLHGAVIVAVDDGRMKELQASIAARTTAASAARAPAQDAPFDVTWARTHEDVRAAQRLRHEVFVDEMGARLDVPPGTPPGHDADRFDPFCEHLLVRTRARDDAPSTVIGTYRVLTPQAAQRAGGYYSEGEFDLAPLAPLKPRMVELGRSCVHRDWRSGGVILALWSELGRLMQRNGLETMIGCASVSMRDGGHFASSLWHRLKRTHLASPAWQVRARLALPVHELRDDLDVEPPALIKGYLRCGARVLGAPAWDPDFNTADLPLMVNMSEMPERYRRHAFGQ